MNRTVRVRTPVRLHFGMFSFGRSDVAQFGGVGMMVEPPAVQVLVRPAPRFAASGRLSDRVAACVKNVCTAWQIDAPTCEIVVEQAPRAHVGLGAGTQLALAVAAGVAQFLDRPAGSPQDLALAAGRGRRSAVGTYGFLHGGLIVDGGKLHLEALGRLEARQAVPEAWRVVLFPAETKPGLAGQREADAFARLPAMPAEMTDELRHIAHDALLPALERGDACAFGEAVYRFGALAGSAFAAVQGGPFRSPRTAELVSAVRQRGVPGVGQSSWGPTLFAICRDQAQADDLASWLIRHRAIRGEDLAIARANNRGATVCVEARST